VVELVNFQLGAENLRRLPTILLVAGLHGDEELGISTLLHFLQTVAFAYQYNDDWYRILNHVRFVVVPIANISGYANKIKKETILINSKRETIDPKEDFNWKNQNKCFQTNTSQLLYRLQQRYLISAALIFSGGNEEIVIPAQPKATEQISEPLDYPFFEFVVEAMQEVSKLKQTKTLTTHPFNKHKVVSPYLMWLYGGSEQPEQMKTICFAKSEEFLENYIPVTESSNRVFAMEISLDKKLRPDKDLGSPIKIINEQESEEYSGTVVRGINIIKQFTQMVRPYVNVLSTEVDEEKKTLKVKMDVKGCKEVDHIEFKSDEDTPEWNSTISSGFFLSSGLEITYDLEKLKKQNSKNLIDLNFGIYCDSNIFKSEEKTRQVTHIGRNKLEKFKLVSDRNYLLDSTQLPKVQILDVDLTSPRHTLNYSRNPQIVVMSKITTLALEIGPVTPLTISFNEETSEISLKYHSNWVPTDQTMADELKDEGLKFGLNNLKKDMLGSPDFMEKLKQMDDFKDQLSITVYRKMGMSNTVYDLKNEPKPKYKSNQSSDKSNKKSLALNTTPKKKKKEESKEKNDFKINGGIFEINRSSQSYIDAVSKINDIFRVIGFGIGLNASQKLIYNYFLDYVGFSCLIKIVNQTKNDEDSNTKMTDVSDKLVSGLNLYLKGRLEISSMKEFNLNSMEDVIQFEEQDLIRKSPPVSGLMLMTGGMYCSTISHNIIKNHDAFTNSFKLKYRNNPSILKKVDFYGVTLMPLEGDSSKVSLTLYVSSFNPSTKYFIYNNSQKFELLPIEPAEKIKVIKSEPSIKVLKFQKIINWREANFIGREIYIYDDSDNNRVLDCTMKSFTGEEGVIKDFKTQRETLNILIDKKFLPGVKPVETKDEDRAEIKLAGKKLLNLIGKKPEIEKPPEEAPWDKTLAWVFVVLLMSGGVFFSWYFKVWEMFDDLSEKDDDSTVPLENEAKEVEGKKKKDTVVIEENKD
jgi:hypothetical protein